MDSQDSYLQTTDSQHTVTHRHQIVRTQLPTDNRQPGDSYLHTTDSQDTITYRQQTVRTPTDNRQSGDLQTTDSHDTYR